MNFLPYPIILLVDMLSKFLSLVVHIPMHSIFLLIVFLTYGTLYLIMLSVAPL